MCDQYVVREDLVCNFQWSLFRSPQHPFRGSACAASDTLPYAVSCFTLKKMIGTKLAHYEITSHIGSGGMGDVYQATDAKLGRSVAIKLLPDAFSHDTERMARFQREARVLAALNHPNIAAIHGLEEI